MSAPLPSSERSEDVGSEPHGISRLRAPLMRRMVQAAVCSTQGGIGLRAMARLRVSPWFALRNAPMVDDGPRVVQDPGPHPLGRRTREHVNKTMDWVGTATWRSSGEPRGERCPECGDTMQDERVFRSGHAVGRWYRCDGCRVSRVVPLLA